MQSGGGHPVAEGQSGAESGIAACVLENRVGRLRNEFLLFSVALSRTADFWPPPHSAANFFVPFREYFVGTNLIGRAGR